MNPAIPSKYTRPGPMAIRLLVDALMSGPHTYADLSEICGLHRTTLCRWLTAWRRPANGMPRCVYIAEWVVDHMGRQNTPAFVWGNKRDAKPKPVSNAERQRHARQRRKKAALAAALLQATAGPPRQAA